MIYIILMVEGVSYINMMNHHKIKPFDINVV